MIFVLLDLSYLCMAGTTQLIDMMLYRDKIEVHITNNNLTSIWENTAADVTALLKPSQQLRSLP